MKKNYFLIVIIMLVTFSLQAWSGSGSYADPYQILTVADLAQLATDLSTSPQWTYYNLYFKLMNDLDLNVAPYNTGTGWLPIGRYNKEFCSYFDGNNKTISGLYINNPSQSWMGLFGKTYYAHIQNLKVNNVNITGYTYVGGLAGELYAGTTVDNCSTTGSLYGTAGNVGGLAGNYYSTCTITKCFSNASILGNNGLGGLLGSGGSSSSIVQDCYSTGNVTLITGTYNNYAGGFIGFHQSSGSLINCYSTGLVTAVATNTGAFCGYNEGTVTRCYWDKETSGRTTSAGSADSFGKTTAEMKQQATYIGWDFTTPIWKIDSNNNGYPYLAWFVFPAMSPAAQPTDLVFSTTKTGENNNIILNFTASASATNYLVVRNTSSFPTFVPTNGIAYSTGAQGSDQIISVGTETTVSDNSATLGTTYYYNIYAFNGSGTNTAYLTTDPLNGSTFLSTNNAGVISNTTNTISANFPAQGIDITFPNGSTGTSLTISKNTAIPESNFSALPNVRGIRNLYFNVLSTNPSPGLYTIVIDFSSLSLTQTQWNNFVVLKRHDSSAAWQNVLALGATIDSRQTDGVWGKFTVSGLSSFSDFAGGEQSTVFTVTTANETGAGSLKQCILDAVDGDMINFNTTAMGTNQITLTSPVVLNKDLTLIGPDGGIILNGNNVTMVLANGVDGVSTPTSRLEKIIIKNGEDSNDRVAGIDNYGTLTLVNCLICNNNELGINTGIGGIGAILSNGNLTMINTTIAGNAGRLTDSGVGGIWCGGDLNIYNSIISGNTGEYTNMGSNITISRNSCYQSLDGYIILDSANDLPEGANPQFSGNVLDPYLILGTSPCADAGDNAYSFDTTDLRGSARKLNKTNATSGTIDMGAYEYAYGDDTLPVELSAFTAICDVENDVKISWTTQSESNMLGYHLYRATENEISASVNVTVGIIEAHNISSTYNYSYTDAETELSTQYYYWLQSVELMGAVNYYGPIPIKTGNGQNPETPGIPLVTKLKSAYPNPFNPSTSIAYDLAEQANVNIEIFNIKGQKVTSLLNETKQPGKYNITWNGKDSANKNCSGGVYFYKMKAGKYTETKKILMLK